MGNNYQPGGSGGGSGGDFLSALLNAEVSITSATTVSTFDTLYVCSGTSANYAVTLPACSGNAGKFIGLRMAPALTQLVTLTAAGSDLIDGQATRVMWANEVAILYCDGTSWTKIGGKTIPMQCVMQLDDAVGQQSVSTSTVTKIALNAVLIDNTGQMASPSNGYINILRSSQYLIAGDVSLENPSAGNPGYEAFALPNVNNNLSNNGGFMINPPMYGFSPTTTSTGSNTYSSTPFSQPRRLNTGDFVQIMVFQSSGLTLVTRNQSGLSIVYPSMSIIETPSW